MMGIVVVALLLLIGAGQIIAAVYILAGIGWALLALGLTTIAAGLIVLRGAQSG